MYAKGFKIMQKYSNLINKMEKKAKKKVWKPLGLKLVHL